MIKVIGIFSAFVLFSYLCFYSSNYNDQYQVYIKNDKIMKACSAEETCEFVVLDEYDDQYVFISEINFNDQDNWELVPVVKPLYKVGDRIKQKNGNTKVIILFSIHKIRKKNQLGEMSHERKRGCEC